MLHSVTVSNTIQKTSPSLGVSCQQRPIYDPETLIGFLKKLAKKWTFQLESGSTTGYEHYQGRMSLWKVKRGSELKKLMDGMGMPVPNYCQPTTTEEHKKEAFYAVKEDTRIVELTVRNPAGGLHSHIGKELLAPNDVVPGTSACAYRGTPVGPFLNRTLLGA